MKAALKTDLKIVAWLPAQALILAVRAYQLLISPWFGPVCRYHPSCSNYMIAAVRKHGFLAGLARRAADRPLSSLASWRLRSALISRPREQKRRRKPNSL